MLSPSVKAKGSSIPPVLSNGGGGLFRFLPFLVLAFSLTVTYHLWTNAQQTSAQNLQADFDFRVRETAERIKQRLLAYEYVLRGAQSLFSASKSVERDEFHAYVNNLHLEDNYPGIQGVGFSLIVSPTQRNSHIAAVRKETFRKGESEYHMWPEGKRDLYTSIVYLEPFVGRNLRAFGYDMYSEPVRRKAMERARDTGEASMSGKVLLIQETEQDVQAGFLMYLPVYRSGTLPASISERRREIIGWVYAPFRMNDLMHGISGERASELDVEVYDGNKSNNTLMYDPDNSPDDHASARFGTSLPFDIAGHHWILEIHSYPPFEARMTPQKTEIIGLSGIAVSLLLAILTWSLARGRERALAYAQEMNRELIQSEERYDIATTIGKVGTWDWNPASGELAWNDETFRLMGYAPGSIKPSYELYLQLLHPEDRMILDSAVQAALHDKKPYDLDCRIILSSGEERVCHVSGKVDFDADGQPIRMLGTIHDITERKRAEDELRKLSTAIEQNPASVVITDLEARIQYVNPRFTEVTGYSVAEAIGQNPRILQSKQTSKEVYLELWGKLTNGQSWHGELLNKRKNGELYWEETHISPVKDSSGTTTHYVAVKADITKRKQIEAALMDSEQRYHLLFENNPMPMWVIEENTLKFLMVNERAIEHYGYTREEFSRMTLRDIRLQEDVPELERRFSNSPDNRIMSEWRHMKKDGSIITVRVTTVPMMFGDIPARIALIQDITESKAAEEKLIKGEASLRAILDNVPYLVWQKDLNGRFVAVNRAFFNTTGLAQIQDVLGKTDFDLWPEELARKYRADDAEVISTRKQKLTEEMSMDNGETHWVETFKAPVTDMSGNLLGITGFAQDITVRKNAEGKIRHLAHYDPLTDLPNRTLFSDRLQQALITAKRDKVHLALMFIDLDKFKPINDELGHHVGDLLLKEAAERMQDCMRESDTVARIGGDEFVVLLPVIEAEQDAILVAEKIRSALNQPFVLIGKSLRISSSTGIAVYPEHGKDETQLMKNADIAMYHAKEGGRNSVVFYEQSMRND